MNLLPSTRIALLSSTLMLGIVLFISIAESEITEAGVTIPINNSNLQNTLQEEQEEKLQQQELERRNAIIQKIDAVTLPDISAHAIYIHLVENNQPLLKRRETKHLAPASITKLLTALIAREKLPPTHWVMISEKASKVEEKNSHAPAGERFQRDDLITMTLVESTNDTATALADAVGRELGGQNFEQRQALFRNHMNKRAKEIGLTDTHFENPSGLDATPYFICSDTATTSMSLDETISCEYIEADHHSTAEDLALLATYILENDPELLEITRTIETTIVSEDEIAYDVKSTNDLLIEYPNLLGGKTGFTDNAGETILLTYAIDTDTTVVIVLLRSEDRFADGRRVIEWLEKVFNSIKI